MYNTDNRRYVYVTVAFTAEGAMRPINLKWENGIIYDIEYVREVVPNQVSGNMWMGDLYRVIIRGQEKNLYFERGACKKWYCPGKWFLIVE